MEDTMLYSPYVQIFCADDGWRFRGLQPTDFYHRDTLRAAMEGPSHGPYASPEAAAEAAIEELGLRDGEWLELLVQFANLDTAVGRAAATLLVGLSPQRGRRAEVANKLAADLRVAHRKR